MFLRRLTKFSHLDPQNAKPPPPLQPPHYLFPSEPQSNRTIFLLNLCIKKHLKAVNEIRTSLALFNASAKAELGSTGAAGGGGTLLKAIASAIFTYSAREEERNALRSARNYGKYDDWRALSIEPQDTQFTFSPSHGLLVAAFKAGVNLNGIFAPLNTGLVQWGCSKHGTRLIFWMFHATRLTPLRPSTNNTVI